MRQQLEGERKEAMSPLRANNPDLLSVLLKSIAVGQRNQNILTAIMVVVFGYVFVNSFLEKNINVTEVSVSEARILGDNQLCPGDVLRIHVHLSAKGSGVIISDTSVESVTTNTVVATEEGKRYPFSDSLEQDIPFLWTVPRTYFNPATGVIEAFPPDDYMRNISFTARGSDSTLFDMASLHFTVPESCFQ